MLRLLSAAACLLTLGVTSCLAEEAAAPEDAARLVRRIVDQAGGRDQLLSRFTIQERLNVSKDPEAAPGKPRESVFDGHRDWWFRGGEGAKWNKKKDEPAVDLVWVWTRQAFVDAASKFELLPEIVEDDTRLVGLRISGSIEPPLDAYFDAETLKLGQIDWRRDIHRFSDWKESAGISYPARCVGYRKQTGKPWYVSEILTIRRLEQLPEELKPAE